MHQRLHSGTRIYAHHSRPVRLHHSLPNQTGEKRDFLILVLHVDDFAAVGRRDRLAWFTNKMKLRFSIKHQPANQFLNIKIDRAPDGSICLSQQHYLEQVLAEFDMLDSKPVFTPLARGSERTLLEGNPKSKRVPKPLNPELHTLYRTIIGKLMYAMVATCPDLAFPLSMLGRYASAPNNLHLSMAIRLLQYVKATLDLGIYFAHTKRTRAHPIDLEGYADTSYASTEGRKSVTGFCFYLGNALVSWCAKTQSSIATSTAVAETYAVYDAVRELLSLRTLCEDLGYPQATPTRLWNDNLTTTGIANETAKYDKTKHIAVKYRWVHEQTKVEQVVDIDYVPSLANNADTLTKQLEVTRFQQSCNDFGLRPTPRIP